MRFSLLGYSHLKRVILVWLIPVLMFVLGLVLLYFANRFPGFASWYAMRVFPVFVHTVGRFWSFMPVSGFEFLLGAGLVYVIVWVVRAVIGCVRSRRRSFIYWHDEKGFLLRLRGMVLGVFYLAAALFLMFVLTAGINYSRESFAYHVGITMQEPCVDELEELFIMLAERAHVLVGYIETCEDGRFALRREGMHEYARLAMHGLEYRYGGLGSYFPQAKSPMISRVLSHMNIGGFFSPWTMEAHYNGDMPGQSIPFVITHELAHFAGHMREDEANFIAYLASRDSHHPDFKYSAVYAAIRYVLSDMRRAVSTERYSELRAMLPEQINRDFAGAREFWQEFQGRPAEMATRANDTYLRLNQQPDGVLSYGRMVQLLLAYYRSSFAYSGRH